MADAVSGDDPAPRVLSEIQSGEGLSLSAVGRSFPGHRGNDAVDPSTVFTSCHLCGVRWWFVCPLVRDAATCGRRVRKLYLRGRYFGCRQYHDLAYTSSQESDSRVYAALRGGLVLGRFDRPDRMSVAQLGLRATASTHGRRGRRRPRRRRTRRLSRRAQDGLAPKSNSAAPGRRLTPICASNGSKRGDGS